MPRGKVEKYVTISVPAMCGEPPCDVRVPVLRNKKLSDYQKGCIDQDLWQRLYAVTVASKGQVIS